MTVLLKRVYVNDSASHFHNRISCFVKLKKNYKVFPQFMTFCQIA